MQLMDKRSSRALIVIFAGLLVFFVFRRAWISDDAMITFRVVDNFLNGYGLRWNVIERVQSYTNPLWMLVLIPLSIGTSNVSLSALILGIGLTVGSVVMLARRALTPFGAILGISILALSGAFVDYSTSGLENPLTVFLLIIFLSRFYVSEWSERDVFWLSFIASLGLVNRLDSALFYAPMLIYVVFAMPNKGKGLLWLIAGQFPIVTWEIFATIYYGFPLPNTYYAKLGAGVPQNELYAQGLIYIKDNLFRDPITVPMIFLGMFSPILSKARWRSLAVSIGLALSMFYILRIGGDFMDGRFLMVPLAVAVFMIAQQSIFQERWLIFVGIFAAVILLGISNPLPTFLVESHDTSSEFREGITTERILYSNYQQGWLKEPRWYALTPITPSTEQITAPTVIDGYAIGRHGLTSGPSVHIIDHFALADPLLARLPAPYRAEWNIGHLRRDIPDGYKETLESGYNMIEDESLADFYDKLVLITRAPLFAPERLQTIIDMNLGRYNDLIEPFEYQYANRIDKFYDTLREILDGDPDAEIGRPQNCDNGIDIVGRGIFVRMSGLFRSQVINISFNETVASYRILFWRSGNVVGSVDLFHAQGENIVYVPQHVVDSGYTEIHILPIFKIVENSCLIDLHVHHIRDVYNLMFNAIDDIADGDLLLIQSSSLWDSYLVDYVSNQESGFLPNVDIVYVNDDTDNTSLNLDNAQTIHAYDSALADVIRDHLSTNQRIWVLQAHEKLPDYTMMSVLHSEADLLDTDDLLYQTLVIYGVSE